MECPLRHDIISTVYRYMGTNEIIQPQGGIMKFVDIKDTQGTSMAVNADHIAHIHMDKASKLCIITLTSDRRIQTPMFQNIQQAVKYCTTTSVDTSRVGELRR